MKENLLKTFSILVILLITQVSDSQKLVILHTNDMHSMLTGFGPELSYTPMTVNDDETIGGFARLATLFKNEKAENPNSTLIVDAGDFLMGTIFQADEQTSGFQIALMKKMGYDAITLGNHEFDFGPDILSKIILASKKNAEIPQIIASNIVFSETSNADNELEKLYKDKTIKEYTIIEKNSLKLGIIGIVGQDADGVAPNAKPVSFSKQIKTVQRLTDKLKNEEKVDLVILLSHSGFYPNEKGVYEGEDLKIAEKVKNLDVIISGHTHVSTEKAIKVNNTIIVQTGAYVKNLGRLELNIENKKIKNYNFSLIQLNDKILGDEEVNSLIDKHKADIDEKYFKPYGLSYSLPIGETDYTMKTDSYVDKKAGTVGQFVADAIKFYVDKHSDKVDLTIEASGTIRENILKGKITAPDLFRVSPLGIGANQTPGYPIAKLYITGKELKGLMEVIVKTHATPGADSYLNYSGVKIDVNMDKGLLRKVQKVYIEDKEIDISKSNTKLYSIAASSYLLKFIGRIKKMTFGLIKIVPKDEKGNAITDINKQIIDFDKNTAGIQEGKIWLALIEYLKSLEDKNNNGLPEIPEKYKQ
ncbi:MAG: bifunctional metallophosphatase/5'-nucleotidase [Bacteroidales bacterium]|nr:bifunctional metallophosphatase/5'-nucleotidase [Bacteroidales bacterium]MBN2758840.1 bifunctional metallophosphatase/5'-nucleotidase [Bacteroidales bacterium]